MVFQIFYQRFIKNFSQVFAPLTKLPDPLQQFVVDVDASDVVVGGFLSQWSDDSQLYSCAFFSCRFTDTERNYDAGNRSLLA